MIASELQSVDFQPSQLPGNNNKDTSCVRQEIHFESVNYLGLVQLKEHLIIDLFYLISSQINGCDSIDCRKCSSTHITDQVIAQE